MILNKNFINVWEDAYPEAYDIFPGKIRKDGSARIPDLVTSQKNRIFDLDRLREVESKISNFMKAVKICQQHPVPEGLLKFLLIESSNGKNLLQNFRFWLFLKPLHKNIFDSTSLSLSS